MAYVLTLGEIRTRIQYKIGDTKNATRLDEWINDVIQQLTGDLFFPELRSDGSDTFTGDGSAREFDLPEDFQAMGWVFYRAQSRDLEEITTREMIEEWERSDSNTTVGFVSAYAILGRTGTADSEGLATYQIRLDRVLATGEVLEYEYYKRHPELSNDADLLLLPSHLGSIIVDGVLMEAAQWNNNVDKFMIYERQYTKKLKRLKRSQNRFPNLSRRFGYARSRVRGGYCLPETIPPPS
jgi:hypothetical protein